MSRIYPDEVVTYKNKKWLFRRKYLESGETWLGPKALHWYNVTECEWSHLMLEQKKFVRQDYFDNQGFATHNYHKTGDTANYGRCVMIWLVPFTETTEWGEYSL